MKHDHINIIDMQYRLDGFYYLLLALPHGEAEWMCVTKEAYDKCKIKTYKRKPKVKP